MLRSDNALSVYSNVQELQAMANIFNIPIDVVTHGSRVSEWRERILPMREATGLAEFREGHFPHTNDTHFDFLVADSSRLISNGLLGRARDDKVDQVPANLQVQEWQTVSRRKGTRG